MDLLHADEVRPSSSALKTSVNGQTWISHDQLKQEAEKKGPTAQEKNAAEDAKARARVQERMKRNADAESHADVESTVETGSPTATRLVIFGAGIPAVGIIIGATLDVADVLVVAEGALEAVKVRIVLEEALETAMKEAAIKAADEAAAVEEALEPQVQSVARYLTQ